MSRKRSVFGLGDDDEEEEELARARAAAARARIAALQAHGDGAAEEQAEETTASEAVEEEEEEEIDPLDAFMANLGADEAAEEHGGGGGARMDEEAEAEEGALLASLEADRERESVAAARNEAQSAEEEERRARQQSQEQVADLKAVDHAAMDYAPFRRVFYTQRGGGDEAAAREAQEALRAKLEVHVEGENVPHAVDTFSSLPLGSVLLDALARRAFHTPTPIQAQALPAALAGRDVIGMAKTGSGKTLAYTLPMLVHVGEQRQIGHREGPVGLVIAPTRELVQQIYVEANRLCKRLALTVLPIYGGMDKHQQMKDLRKGTHVVVATPGRFIDCIRGKACTLERVTFLVLDEADRMFDMGFAPQIRAIVSNVRPDRQTLLFSATFKRSIEELARTIVRDPVRVRVGNTGASNEDVRQVACVLANNEAKWPWLTEHLEQFVTAGSVIVFVAQTNQCDVVAKLFNSAGYPAVALHGDKDQGERHAALADFRRGRANVLIATDVAARGLDIKSVKVVVNFDAPRSIDAHVHRIGRTGRAGDKDGVAYTLLTSSDAKFAVHLRDNMLAAGQRVEAPLARLAQRGEQLRQADRRGQKGKNSHQHQANNQHQHHNNNRQHHEDHDFR